MLFAANQCLLSNCVVCSESVFTVELCSLQRSSVRGQIVLCAVNQRLLPNCIVSNESVFADELCCVQQIIVCC
jgi:hypothetical protein